MSKINRYVPILRTKKCEFAAIKNLDPQIVQLITPFFEFRSMGIKRNNEHLTIDEYLEKNCRYILKHWHQQCIVDLYGIPHSTKLENSRSPVNLILNTLRNGGLTVIPTIGLDREVEYIREVKSFMESNGVDICLRLERDDLQLPQSTANKINEMLENMNILPEMVHFLIDMRFINEESVETLFDLIAEFACHSDINAWKSFIISGCSMPEDVSGLIPGTNNMIRRKEYELWCLINENFPLIGRVAYYSDYAIIHPDKQDVIVTASKIATKIRYTMDNHWLILRGTRHEDSKTRRIEFQELSYNITNDTNYKGMQYSWGDLMVYECAMRTKAYCAPAKWVEIDINHHLTFVAQQISSSSFFS